jgi:hypothetical protein
MRRFALSFGRFVHPFSAILNRGGEPGAEGFAGATIPGAIERLHVERAHAAVHPVHLISPDGRRRAARVNAVRDIFSRPRSD